MNESCHTYEWVMSHIWISHVTHMNESCHTYEWVMSHIWMSRVTRMNESCHRGVCVWLTHTLHLDVRTRKSCAWSVVSQIRMSHVKHIFESCHIHKSNCVTHMNESCHTYEWVMSHIWMSRVTGVCVCDAQILASGCEHTVVVYMHPLEFSKTSNTGCLLQILGIVFRCVAVCCSVWILCFVVLQCVAVFCNVLQCF